MAGKFELTKSKSGKVRFVLKAANGKVILTSQQYSSKRGAQSGIESVRKNAAADANYLRKSSKKNEPYFVLRAANRQIIGTSEMYSSNSAMENGINSVKANARTVKVEDLSV